MATPDLDPQQLLDTLTERLRAELAARGIDQFQMIGIHRGGVWVARALAERLGRADAPMGSLNISFYRDDFSRIGMHPEVNPSDLPFEVEDQHIVLVDDVLQSGRTIRAALNEIFDFGRPASVLLAILVERGGRELPIHADVVGAHVELAANEQIKLSGPDPLKLTVIAP